MYFFQCEGVKWSGRRSRTIAVPEQHRSVSGWQAHHIRSRWRFDYLNADWKHCLFGLSRWFNGTSVGSLYYGDTDLSAFAQFSTDCCACWRRTKSKNTNTLLTKSFAYLCNDTNLYANRFRFRQTAVTRLGYRLTDEITRNCCMVTGNNTFSNLLHSQFTHFYLYL